MLLLLALACTSDPEPTDDTGGPGDDAIDDTDDTDDTDTDDTDTTDPSDGDGDGAMADVDCDDSDPSVYPGAAEVCDALDQDCDGLVDEGLPSVAYLTDLIYNGSPASGGYWFGYDAEDNTVLVGRDANADGTLETYQRFEWAEGALAAEEQSTDGVNPSYRVEYDRNEEGWIIVGRLDTEGDGAWNYAYGYDYVDGRYAGYWFDNGYDGTYEVEQRYEYDANGNVEHFWEDDGDGVIDYETWYTYDGDHILGYTSDTDGDGVFETTATYTWEGDRLLEEVVSGGLYPSRRTYTYAEGDDRYDSMDYDAGDDGSLDWRYGYEWDGELITGQTYDEFGDGLAVTAYTYTYDEEGRTTAASVALDGTYTSFTEYEYADDVLYAIRYDINGDGAWDHVTLYNARGGVTYTSVDSAGDGTYDYINTYEYDTRLRRIGATQDTLGDGVLEYEQSALDGYTCGEM